MNKVIFLDINKLPGSAVVWYLEVVSKPQIRFKGKASGRSGKRSPANGGMSSTFTGGLQRSHWALDGVLKTLLGVYDPE